MSKTAGTEADIPVFNFLGLNPKAPTSALARCNVTTNRQAALWAGMERLCRQFLEHGFVIAHDNSYIEKSLCTLDGKLFAEVRLND